MKDFFKQKKGITLIALVITIIVLLILAGISISMLSGDNSILHKATDTKQTSERAEAKEQAQMDIMAYIADKTANHQDASLDDEKVKEILSDNKSYVKVAGDTSFTTAKGEYEIPYSELYQSNGSTNDDDTPSDTEYPYRTPYIPTNFSHVDETTWNSGFTIKGNAGTVNENDEFVWVPCVTDQALVKPGDIVQTFEKHFSSETQATDPSRQDPEHKTYQGADDASFYIDEESTASAVSAIRTSVETYGGFYIAKYEASQDNGTAKSVSGASVWNYITRANAVTTAASMIPATTGCKSALISGECWDTTMQWIKQTTGTNYDIDSTGKGYYNQSIPTNTGYYAVNGIYDMAGNVCEWTTENYSTDVGNTNAVHRGGYWENYASNSPAGSRFATSDWEWESIGFRVVLYK